MMKLHSCPLTAADNPVLIPAEPISLDRAVEQVSGFETGAVTSFCGRVRETEIGRPISGITYQVYHGMAEKEIAQIIGQAQELWAVRAVVQHRFGKVPAGEASLVVACSAVHRRESFEACQFVVDAIKANVPIWKAGFES